MSSIALANSAYPALYLFSPFFDLYDTDQSINFQTADYFSDFKPQGRYYKTYISSPDLVDQQEIKNLRLEDVELRKIVGDSKSLFNSQKLDLEVQGNKIKDLVKKVHRKRRNRIPECNDDVVMECEAIRNLDNPQFKAIILRNEDGTYTP